MSQNGLRCWCERAISSPHLPGVGVLQGPRATAEPTLTARCEASYWLITSVVPETVEHELKDSTLE